MKIGSYHIRLKNNYADLFIPILFAALLIYYMLASRHIINTDAMLLIRPLAISMALLLVFIVKGEFIIQKVDDSPPEEKKPYFSSKEEYIKLISFTFLILLYFVALIYVGFIISTPVFSAAAMFALGVRNIKVLILVPVLLTASTYTLFRVVLSVNLPVGMLGI